MQKGKIWKLVDLWLPPVFWALVIFKFSSGSVPKASESFWIDFIIKKIGHIILFATLAVLVYRGLTGSGIGRVKAAILALIFAAIYGISDEVHQIYTQGREARVRDVVIDIFGSGTVLFVINKFISRFPKRMRDILLSIGIN